MRAHLCHRCGLRTPDSRWRISLLRSWPALQKNAYRVKSTTKFYVCNSIIISAKVSYCDGVKYSGPYRGMSTGCRFLLVIRACFAPIRSWELMFFKRWNMVSFPAYGDFSHSSLDPRLYILKPAKRPFRTYLDLIRSFWCGATEYFPRALDHF